MITHSCIGIDVGETCGIGFIDYQDQKIVGRTLVQVNFEAAQFVLEACLTSYYKAPDIYRVAGVEAFIAGKSAGTKGDTAEVTRQLAFRFTEQLQMWGYHVKLRPAVEVKKWATNKLLEAAGITVKAEQRHANDGARHALFSACNDAYRHSPLR